MSDFTSSADVTAQFNSNDIQENKVMAILAYLSWLVLVPILGAKDSKFARFHANQGLILAIIEIISWAVFGVLSLIPLLGILFSVISWLVSIFCLVLSIIGIINAANGKAKTLPIIGSINILK